MTVAEPVGYCDFIIPSLYDNSPFGKVLLIESVTKCKANLFFIFTVKNNDYVHYEIVFL